MIDIAAAVIRTNGGPFEMEQLVLDEPRSNEVLVRLVATGLCHSDIYFSQVGGVPIVLGHEGASIVERVGDGVLDFHPGDRVVMSYNSCGSCGPCLTGRPAYCEKFLTYNLSGLRPDGSHSIHTPGGTPVGGSFFGQSSFATYSLAYARNLVKVPDIVGDELFTILGPLGCGIQTGAGGVLNSLNPAAGSTIVISGAGSVGLSSVLGAVVSEAAQIIAVDVNAERLDVAKRLGATHIINGRQTPDVAAAIRDITHGGADFAVDTTGNMKVVRSLVEGTNSSGTIGLIGVGKPGAELLLDHSILAAGRTIKGVIEGDAIPQLFIPKMIALHLQGRFPFDSFVTRYAFPDLQQAVEDSENGSTIKAVLTF